jgi:hypothetical protein
MDVGFATVHVATGLSIATRGQDGPTIFGDENIVSWLLISSD